MSFVGAAPKMWTKANDSPVTEVDIAVEGLLREHLRPARPDYGWLSEETADDISGADGAANLRHRPDRWDLSFIAGGTDWTIPIAVIEAGRPVAAALIAPRRGEFYTAILGGGAFLNGAPIRVSERERPGRRDPCRIAAAPQMA